MSLHESVGPATAGSPLSLAVRRPGHAVMSHLLDELARRDATGPVPADLMSWYSGAEGEILVGQELARLPQGWAVLHAVPAGPTADIDHLLIGPPGVFVVNTKRHRNRRVRVGTHVTWIDGGREDFYQRDLLGRTAKVAAIVRPWVEADAAKPLLVFVDAASLTLAGPQRVGALRVGELVDHLLALPDRLSPALVHGLAAVVSRPATWGRSASVLHEPDPTGRFLALIPATSAVRATRPTSRPHVVVRSRIGARSCTTTPTPRYSPSQLRRIVRRTVGALAAVVLAPVAALTALALLGASWQSLLGR